MMSYIQIHTRAFLLTAMAVLLAACATAERHHGAVMTDEASALLQSHAAQVVRMRPVRATQMGLYDDDIGVRLADAMDDYGTGSLREWRRNVRAMRAELKALPDDAIDPFTRKVMDNIYRVYQGAEDIPFGYVDSQGRHRPFIINPLEHPLQYVPFVMTRFQRIESAEDAADYLRRMWALSSLVDSVLGKFNADADAGWIPPRPVLEGGLSFLEDFTRGAPDQHSLVTNLVDKVATVRELDEEQRDKIRNEAIAIMIRVVYPSYQNAAETVRARLPETDQRAGIWARPLGAKFYEAAIRNESGSLRSADEIHQLGLQEVARILAEMDQRLDALGLTSGSVAERMRTLAAEKQFLFPDSDAGRAALLAKARSDLADITARLPNYFGVLPRQAVRIERMPLEAEAGGAMGIYYGPPIGGGGEGLFVLNMRSMTELPAFTIPTLVYHETMPGHHLQYSIARARTRRPLLWTQAPTGGFGEGWGLYAELLAAEMGVYEDDAYGDLGRLRDELKRAVRLVVDTGLHSKRWSMTKAMTYMSETTGKGQQEVRAEVVRYMAWPGQALSYKMGMIGLLELRQEARKAFQARGEAFDIREFHDRVLASSPAPVSIIKAALKPWYRGKETRQ